MIYHILNGDALEEKFPRKELGGEVIVIREAFMEGPVAMEMDHAYWEERAKYISSQFGPTPETYLTSIGTELEKMKAILSTDSVYLWFEDDLFCQVNMWFSVHYILDFSKPSFFRVFPVEDKLQWRGFGDADAEGLTTLFSEAQEFWNGDVRLTQKLWRAFVEQDRESLKSLATTATLVYRFLPQVIAAHLERLDEDETHRQPQRLLHAIMKEGHSEFEKIFAAFSQRAGIYGYGDEQIRIILKEMKN